MRPVNVGEQHVEENTLVETHHELLLRRDTKHLHVATTASLALAEGKGLQSSQVRRDWKCS